MLLWRAPTGKSGDGPVSGNGQPAQLEERTRSAESNLRVPFARWGALCLVPGPDDTRSRGAHRVMIPAYTFGCPAGPGPRPLPRGVLGCTRWARGRHVAIHAPRPPRSRAVIPDALFDKIRRLEVRTRGQVENIFGGRTTPRSQSWGEPRSVRRTS